MKEISRNQSGAVLVTFAILLVALLGFAALATEAGRWYLVRSELSKAVDAAAMAGAKNISNPFVTVDTLAQEVGDENFPAGQLGTPSSGEGSISFTTTVPETNKVQVVGRVSAIAILARLFGIERVASRSSGVAQKKEVEIIMVLDRSGSMAGTPLANLKTAAKSFLDFFEETQDEDKVGLITYSTGVRVDFPLGSNFVAPMKAKIDVMTIPILGDRDTNMEDAIDRADGLGGFTDQTGLPGDQRKQQFMIFFSDGKANAFRGNFTRDGITYDAVVPDPYDVDWNQGLHNPNTGNPIGVDFKPTGDGKPAATSKCLVLNTKWYVFVDRPVPGYPDPESCNIPNNTLQNYVMNTAKQMTIEHAQELKDKYVKIYTIGLGSVDKSILSAIASGPQFEYYAPTSGDLQAIFNTIAKEIKLRLVE